MTGLQELPDGRKGSRLGLMASSSQCNGKEGRPLERKETERGLTEGDKAHADLCESWVGRVSQGLGTQQSGSLGRWWTGSTPAYITVSFSQLHFATRVQEHRKWMS